MLHTVYKTTNLLNGKYYFGYHKTGNPQDDYLGSGTYIQKAVAKHGAENFKKEVLFTYLDAGSALGKEAELVEAYRGDPLCKNLRKGGDGGFDYINRNKLALTPKALARRSASQRLRKRPDMAERNRRRTWTEADCLANSARQRGRKSPATSEGNKRRVWTAASREKLGRAQRELKLAWWAAKKSSTP